METKAKFTYYHFSFNQPFTSFDINNNSLENNMFDSDDFKLLLDEINNAKECLQNCNACM